MDSFDIAFILYIYGPFNNVCWPEFNVRSQADIQTGIRIIIIINGEWKRYQNKNDNHFTI